MMPIIGYLKTIGFFNIVFPFFILFAISFVVIYKLLKDRFQKWLVIVITIIASFIIAYLVNRFVIQSLFG